MKGEPDRGADAAVGGEKFPPRAAELVEEASAGPGVLSPEFTRDFCDAAETDVAGLMLRLLPLASARAYPKVSGFRVGAVAMGTPGPGGPALYFGANLELEGVPLSATVHAEQAAVTNAWLRGEEGIAALAVGASPCGHCRQFLRELHAADDLRFYIDGDAPGIHTEKGLADLLPHPFGPAALADVTCRGGVRPALMDPACAGHEIVLADRPSAPPDPLVTRASGAARDSYAPYTHAYSGCALELTDGSVVEGRVTENAAFNPSILPIMSALASLRARYAGPHVPRISRAVMVEVQGAPGRRPACEAALASYAPGVSLEYVSGRLR